MIPPRGTRARFPDDARRALTLAMRITRAVTVALGTGALLLSPACGDDDDGLTEEDVEEEIDDVEDDADDLLDDVEDEVGDDEGDPIEEE